MSVHAGKRLELVRTAKGISRADVCRDSGISYNTLFVWEQGEREPRQSKLRAAASAMKLSAEEEKWLLFEIGDPPDPSKLPSPKSEPKVEFEDRYPSRPPAIIVLRGNGFPEWVLDALLTFAYKSYEDPGRDHWYELAQQLWDEGKGLRKVGGEPIQDKPVDLSELEKPKRRKKT